MGPIRNMFQARKHGPLWKKCKFGPCWLLTIFQKLPTLTMHISLTFDPRSVFLDFLESLGCPLSNPCGLISIESSMFIYEALTQKVFLLTFWKDLKCLSLYLLTGSFLELEGWREVVGNWILFKMSLGGKISDKVWESYAWSKFGWLFLYKP